MKDASYLSSYIVDKVNNFQQNMVNEIAGIGKLLLVNPDTIAAGKGSFTATRRLIMAPFSNDYRKVLNSRKERTGE